MRRREERFGERRRGEMDCSFGLAVCGFVFHSTFMFKSVGV